MKKKRPDMKSRVDRMAAKAYLAVILYQNDQKRLLRALLIEMTVALEQDKRLARHLFPGLMQLCKEHGIELHGAHISDSKRH
jgi:hypothetical protein